MIDGFHKIYDHIFHANERQKYPQRTNDLSVIDTAENTDVKIYSLMSPIVYGRGSGLYRRCGMQLPTMLRAAVEVGQAEMVDGGEGVWGHVHIDDLVELYETLLYKVVQGKTLPFGRDGRAPVLTLFS